MENPHSPTPDKRKIGRPLSFDRTLALEKAMIVFWRFGYETTSIADLTSAMGITPPSLYAAFGDKKRLFLEAVRLYAGDPELLAKSIAEAPSAFDAARDMLVGAATAFSARDTPPGCLLASATASGSAASVDVQRAVADIRRDIAAWLRARIERDIETGKMRVGIDSAALAGLVIAVIQGLSALARDGAQQSALLAIANATLGAWPKSAA